MSKKLSKPSCKRRSRHLFWRVLVGLLFLAAAGAVVCSALGIVSWGVNIGWVALIALLGALALASLLELQWFGVFLPLAGIGTILNIQTDYLPQVDGHIGALWIVAVLLSIGFSILIHKRKWWKDNFDFKVDFDEKYGEVIEGEDDSNAEVSVTLGSTIKHIDTDDFKKARLNAKLSGMKVYFDNAQIKGKSAKIEFNGTMSGYEIYVPHSWKIIDNVHATASGIDEKNARQYNGKDEKTVTLTGNITMSGIEIIYV